MCSGDFMDLALGKQCGNIAKIMQGVTTAKATNLSQFLQGNHSSIIMLKIFKEKRRGQNSCYKQLVLESKCLDSSTITAP